MAVGASPDPVVVGVRAGETDVSVGVDAVRSGPVTPDGSSEPQAASAAVRASARTTLNRVTYLVVCVRVIFFTSVLIGAIANTRWERLPDDMPSVPG